MRLRDPCPPAFLKMEKHGRTLTYESLTEPPDAMRASAAVADHGEAVRARFAAWWTRAAGGDFSGRVPTYFGGTTRHEMLERTVRHTTQPCARSRRGWSRPRWRRRRWPGAISGGCPSPTRAGTRAERPPGRCPPEPEIRRRPRPTPIVGGRSNGVSVSAVGSSRKLDIGAWMSRQADAAGMPVHSRARNWASFWHPVQAFPTIAPARTQTRRTSSLALLD